MVSDNTTIEINKLVKIYNGSAEPAVKGISLSIEKNMIFGLLGPNGAGKTTTISILCGLLKQTEGNVNLCGLSYEKNEDEIKQLIGIVPQDIALYPTLTAFENLQYIGNMYGLKGKNLKGSILDYLEIFGLEQSRDKRIITFSGGMKRRINLIAGLLNNPKILFLDEPTVGVDVQSRYIITKHLKEMSIKGTTIVYTSHLMEEAENLCTQIAIIDEGKIIAIGTPPELFSKYDSVNLEQVFLKITGKRLRD